MPGFIIMIIGLGLAVSPQGIKSMKDSRCKKDPTRCEVKK